MKLHRWQIILIGSVLIFFGIALFVGAWLYKLDKQISERLEGKRFASPIEFYTAPLRIFSGQTLYKNSFKDSLRRLRYKERSTQRGLRSGEYLFMTTAECQANLSEDLPSDTERCVLIAKHLATDSDGTDESESNRPDLALIAMGSGDVVYQVYADEPLKPQAYIELNEVLFAQFYGADPIIRHVIQLGDIPPLCLNAVVAIEDPDFLQHSGVSITGIFRAIVKNTTTFKYSQGGSTITQQLIKNYFLSPEKTIKRKLKEIAMAVLLEAHATKDDILETYLNEAYMGQNGSFQLRGFASAANYYFSKDIQELNLAECSLLAAVLNSPGMYSPFTRPENALKRRSLVLSKMKEFNLASPEEIAIAEVAPLPKEPQKVLSEPAPFFVDAVRREIETRQIDLSEGLKVYTTLDLRAQESAQVAVRAGVERLEKENKKIIELKAAGKTLESMLVSADPFTGEIQAIVGGRNFRASQYNRAVQSQRQVGSIFKPIVYLTALQRGIKGEIPTPLTLIDDNKFTIKYDKQKWTPVNYEKKTYGMIPMFFALKSSLNIATAQLAIQTGASEIVEVAHDLGVDSNLMAVPSIALGSFEMRALEVLEVYTTFARMGERIKLTMIRKVENLDGEVLYLHDPESFRVSNDVDTGILVGMMKQTIINGTAFGVPLWGFKHPAAGKTGTTSDTKDAWFAGFTPYHVAVVWTGYDDNTESGLTGASGAVPTWAEYMKSAASQFPPRDFEWPEGTEVKTLSVEDQIALGVPEETDKKRKLTPIDLVFKK